MSKKLFAVALVLVLVGFASAATTSQDIGAGAGLYVQTSGPAQSNIQAMIQKWQQAGSATQSFQGMYNASAISGKKGSASTNVESLNCLSQDISRYTTNQTALSSISVGTQALRNGTATASVAQFGSQSTPKSVDGSAIMVMSFSSVVPSVQWACGPIGSASNIANINVSECTTVTGGGCHPAPCGN